MLCSSSFEVWSSSLDDLQLLVAGLELLDRRLQALLGVGQLRLDGPQLIARDLVDLDRRCRCAGGRFARRRRFERHQQVGRAAAAVRRSAGSSACRGARRRHPGAGRCCRRSRRGSSRARLRPPTSTSFSSGSTSSSTSSPWRPSRWCRNRPAPAKEWTSSPRLVDQQARRHDPLEERVIGAEQLRQRVAAAGRLEGGVRDPGLALARAGGRAASTGMRASVRLR